MNTTLEYLDIRDTDVTPEQMMRIEKILIKNRSGLRQPAEEMEEEEGKEEIEEKVLDYENPEQANI